MYIEEICDAILITENPIKYKTTLSKNSGHICIKTQKNIRSIQFIFLFINFIITKSLLSLSSRSINAFFWRRPNKKRYFIVFILRNRHIHRPLKNFISAIHQFTQQMETEQLFKCNKKFCPHSIHDKGWCTFYNIYCLCTLSVTCLTLWNVSTSCKFTQGIKSQWYIYITFKICTHTTDFC